MTTTIIRPPRVPGTTPSLWSVVQLTDWKLRHLYRNATRLRVKPRTRAMAIAALTPAGLSGAYLGFCFYVVHERSYRQNWVAALIAAYLGAVVLLYVVMLISVTCSRVYDLITGSRVYMSPRRNATIRVRRRTWGKKAGWHIDNHLAATPGIGSGKAVRQAIVGPLTAAADQHGIDIWAVAADPKLTDIYVSELPGISKVGTKKDGRDLLHRPPMYWLKWAPTPTPNTTP